MSEEALPLSAIFEALTRDGAVISPVEYEKHMDEQRTVVTFQASFAATANERILEVLETQRGVRRVRVEPLP